MNTARFAPKRWHPAATPNPGHRRALHKRLSVALIARILGVGRNTVSRWVRDGHLRGTEPEDLCDFLRAHGWRGRLK